MPRPASTSARLRTAFLLGALMLAVAGSVAQVAADQLELSSVELTMIDENPALQDLGTNSPETLRQALDMIAAALLLEPTTRGLLGLEPEDAAILGNNPALLQVWKNSPEASADLLELIRTAAGSGKSQK